MERDKIVVTICLGSSCFARGNNNNLRFIQSYFAEKKLNDMVAFSGHLCEEVCQKGPTIKIDGQAYYGVTPQILKPILDSHFNK